MALTKPLNEQKVKDGFKNLTFDMIENYNTHAIEEHADRNEIECLDTVLSGHKKSQGMFEYSGKKMDKSMFLKKIIETIMKQKQDDIIAWMKKSNNYNNIDFPVVIRNKQIGKVFSKEDNSNKITEYATSAIRIVIQRNDAMPLGFSLLTAYPDLDTRYKEKTERDLSELVKSTKTYKDSDDMEKIYHLYRTAPNSSMQIYTFDDRYTGEKKLLTVVKDQNPNIIHKIRISKNDCILNTYRNEYAGTSEIPYVRKIQTDYSRISNDRNSYSKDADLNKTSVFERFKRDFPQEAQDINYIQSLMQNHEFLQNINIGPNRDDDHDSKD